MSDTMLIGVLRMIRAVYPKEPPTCPLTWIQMVARCDEAADRIEFDAKRIAELEAQLDTARAESDAASKTYWRDQSEINRLQFQVEVTRLTLTDARTSIVRLAGAASRVSLAAPARGPLWHGSIPIVELNDALRQKYVVDVMSAQAKQGDSNG